MQPSTNEAPPALSLLADHLDAVLEAGETLLELEARCGASAGGEPEAAWAGLDDLVAKARQCEMTIVARTMQARARVRDLARQPGQLGLLLTLFSGGTAQFADAVAELADTAGTQFDTGLDPLAYLRTRGVIAADAGSLRGLDVVKPSEMFLLARTIALGPFLDMCGAVLDALDAAYDVFPAAATARERGAEVADRGPVAR